MIRFSAGLVVVAIGVLIGGVATSKLSLVYIAIAVSAVALVVLAIGVALKRNELFGGGPELAPAGAGASSGVSADQLVDAGDVRGGAGQVREDQPTQPKKVPGPATLAFAAAPAAQAPAPAAAATTATPTVAAPARSAPPVTAPPGPASASAQPGDAAADWQTRPSTPPWSPGDQGRPSWARREQAPDPAPPTVPQSGAAAVAPHAWGNPDPSPAAAARAESGTVAPSWFDRLNQPAAEQAAPPAAAEPAADEPRLADPQSADDSDATPTSADTDTDADDDDWPTRYSWLEEDDTDEAAETSQPADVAVADPDVADADVADADVADADATVAAPVAKPAPDADPEATVVAPVVRPAPAEAVAPEPAPAEADSSDAASPDADADADADDHGATADDAESTPDKAEAADTSAADQPSARPEPDAKLVTVIPGVPRYHDPDCILIRFMDSDDVARKSIPEAKAANCTPCAACQPEG